MSFILNASYEDGKTYPIRKPKDIKYIVIHRLDVGRTPQELYKAFGDGAKYAAGSYTGQKLPYHFFIPNTPTGEINIYQLHPLMEISPHAKSFNQEGIGIAVDGDFTKAPATDKQYALLVLLCAHLIKKLGPLDIVGHTDLPGASNDPTKICPGKFMNLTTLRKDVKKYLRELESGDAITFSLNPKPQPPWI